MQTLLLDSAKCVGKLFMGQRGGGDLAAVVGGRIQRHTAPASADLQQVVTGFEIELLADALQLVDLRLFEAVAGGAEHGR
ncbi:hypothetical protein D3C84_1190960 [compost metagenome]